MYINTNEPALFAENALSATSTQMSNLAEQLATGYQINSPSDNPSGLAISNLMTGELGGINAAIANGNQASNLLNTANGGIQNDMQIVQQIQQLAVQASNGTNTTQDQQDIQNQINQLLTQLDNNSSAINYNGQKLLNGSFGSYVSFTAADSVSSIQLGPDGGSATAGTYSVAFAAGSVTNTEDITVTLASTGVTVASGAFSYASSAAYATAQLVATGANGLNGSLVVTYAASTATANTVAFTINAATTSLNFQVGPQEGSADAINASLGNFSSVSLGLSNINVVGQGGANAQNAITLAQNALSMLTNAQGSVGAQLDQINYTLANLQSESTNLQSSQATIMDANMASVSSQFAQSQILEQTGLQALSTDQQMPGMVLKLLGS